jgi:hypothetical protein
VESSSSEITKRAISGNSDRQFCDFFSEGEGNPKTEAKMLVPPHMIEEQSKIIYQINKYYVERVQTRMTVIDKTIREICQIVQEILREVEVQEPRFISSLSECNGR